MRHWLAILVWFGSAQYGCGQDGFVDGQPKLAFWKIGSKPETVIVLHGGPDATHGYLRPELDGLSKVAKVVYYDQRGIGKSGSADSYVWQAQVLDLDRVIHRFSTHKVFLAASSWGTTLAILYAYQHPEKVRGLLLSGTYSWPGKGMTAGKYQAYIQHLDSLGKSRSQSLKQPDLKETKYTFYEQRQLVDQEEIKRRGYSTITVEKEVLRVGTANTAELVYSLVTAPVLDSLAKIRVPVLLFNGSRKNCDVDWGYKYVKVFPMAELYTIPAACHDPWLSDPKKFCAKSVEFMSRIVKASD
ncbi:alpha/beta fold hydrolase [Spirosoma gilvum]